MNWKDAYEHQMDTWEFLRTGVGQRALTAWAEAECKAMPQKLEVYQRLIPYEESKLLLADPVFVAAEMLDLVDHASKSWKMEPFVKQDIIIPHAFMYFERPVYLRDRRGLEVNVRAMSYAPIRSDPDEAALEGFAISLYSSFDDGGRDIGITEIRAWAEERGHAVPHLTLLHMSPVWFDADPLADSDAATLPERAAVEDWWTFLQVLMRLLTQTIAVRSQHQLERSSRRRGIRKGFEPREVTVIKLRRPRHQPTEAEREVNWTHRWIVGGHWRDQWYPSLGLHRQVWINPYVKGPDDGPLVVKRRAYEWTR